MNKLYLKRCNPKIMDNLKDSFVDKQLQVLSSLYEINNPIGKTYVIESLNPRVELTNIKSNLNRLIYDVYPDKLKSVLETFSSNDVSIEPKPFIKPKQFKKRIFPSPNPNPTDDKCSK